LVGGSLGITWQAVRAEREAKRATQIKDFLVGMFRASDPRISEDKPRGEITARELLDINAGRIETYFSTAPATQIELLGVTADIYRELDETKRSTALYVRETDLARKNYGDANTYTIDGLLGQAYNANIDGDSAGALKLLESVDPLIRQAGMDRSAARARWWMIRGEALMDSADDLEAPRSAYQSAVALFSTVAHDDPLYPDSLLDLGALALGQSEFGAAAAYYRQAIALMKLKSQWDGHLLIADTGLALALKRTGDFAGAKAAFENGTNVAARTYGPSSLHYWAIAGDWAKFRYERGDREGAFQAFETLVGSLPTQKAAFRNASETVQAAEVLRKYGRCLAYDGQGARAIQLLEQARSLMTATVAKLTDDPLLLVDLSQAYEAGGRPEEARKAIQAALDSLERRRAPASQLAVAHEHWGQFLLRHGETEAAGPQFAEVLRLQPNKHTELAVLAQAGMAAIATLRGDMPAALQSSNLAVEQLRQLEGYYDIRLNPYVWGIHAKALFLSGDLQNARAFASRAHEANLAYYDPGSREVREAEALINLIASTSASAR
jgi:tetratricopeptide (TPR) repeat protein